MKIIFSQWRKAMPGRSRRRCRVFSVGPGLSCLIQVILFGFSGFGQQNISAQPTRTTNSPPANRWLIIVETTKRMRPRAEGVQSVVPELVFSGMNGQMWRGDTLGVWTFNEDIHVGQFPLQEWSPGNSQGIALQVSDFLKAQKYEKNSSFEKVLPLMQRLIKSSDYITVLLISDGRDKIQGTPFDDKINTFYQTWSKQENKAQMPFVTAFRAEHGHITNYAVTIPPYPLELPSLPPELAKRVVEEEVQKPSPPPRIVPPLIVHGKKPEPAPVAAVAPESVATNVMPLASTDTNGKTAQDSGPAVAASTKTEKPSAKPPLTIPEPKITENQSKDRLNTGDQTSMVVIPDSPRATETAEGDKPAASSEGPERVPHNIWDSKIIWFGMGVGAVGVCWFFWALGRRSSETYRVSLMRSSDPDKKR